MVIPFCDLKVIPSSYEQQHPNDIPEPSIWVCNHTSNLDVFILLAADLRLRGKNKRPIKCVYWKGLDENPVTKLLFHMCGFISVQMTANGAGVPNDYDRSSFKAMLKETKKAFRDGFDVLLFPEGQLNPNPENGLLPIFHGAFSLAKMSHRPIRMVALHGADRMWHADDSILATKVTGKEVSCRGYPPGHAYETKEEFEAMFQAVVGHFGAAGQDLSADEWGKWFKN